MTLDDAYAACDRIARQHYENFPVASILLPAAMRPHIAAIYAFARAADDFADEGDRTPAERIALLDDWGARLGATVASGSGIPPSAQRLAPSPYADSVFLALGHTIRSRSLPVELFEDLLSAFRQDVDTKRYATWAELMDYCRRSANPVGRLVLRVAGRADDQRDRASDAVCTALQLTNFWQDLERDWQKGRLYVPRDECTRVGAREADLDARVLSPEWRMALSEMAARTRRLFDEGRAVGDSLDGRLRYQLRLTWLCGVRILDRLDEIGFDVFTARPTLGTSDVPALLWNAISWSRPKAA